jgi:hypothetical protein
MVRNVRTAQEPIQDGGATYKNVKNQSLINAMLNILTL